MSMLLVAVALFVVTFCNGDEDAETSYSPIVQTSNGPIRGYIFTSSWTNQTIYAFHGIPFAAPPVGDLRFRDPVHPKKWISIRDCTEDRNSCMQPKFQTFNRFNFLFSMSEDCLYLSVYTPQIDPAGELFPVMVWFHGGGFSEGSGSRFRYGPDLLVAEGVVVVSINYRLGAFGFLSLGTPGIPGNAGLKDQRFALQWVQREIGHFGGDSGKVTIFGQSAGSSSVHLHYLSPLSKGLFHRAIGESGTALNWAFREDGSRYSLELATMLGCNLAQVQACLRRVSAESVLFAQGLVMPSIKDSQEGVGLIFIPCVDRLSSTDPFLPDTPSRLIEQKQGSSVPFMMGINRDEGMMMLALQTEDLIKNVTSYLDNFIDQEVRARSSESKLNKLVERIKHFYFKDANSYQDIINGYNNLYTDFSFGYSTSKSAKAFSTRSQVYLYHFTFQGAFKENMFEDIEAKYNTWGVAHGEELNYLFVRKKINQTTTASREMKTWRRMVRMWTNFAKFGVPTVGTDHLLQNVHWYPVTPVSTRYLSIDDNLTMEEADFLGPTMELWDSITPSSGYLNLSGFTRIKKLSIHEQDLLLRARASRDEHSLYR